MSIVCRMNLRVVTSGWLKVLTCLAVAMALVLSPPSAAHAASGMHDGHHSPSVLLADAVKSEAGHGGHAMHAAFDGGGTSDAGETDKEQQANSCCNGICISVIVLDHDTALPKPVPAEEHSVLDTQTRSVDTIGFLRPPRLLI